MSDDVVQRARADRDHLNNRALWSTDHMRARNLYLTFLSSACDFTVYLVYAFVLVKFGLLQVSL